MLLLLLLETAPAPPLVVPLLQLKLLAVLDSTLLSVVVAAVFVAAATEVANFAVDMSVVFELLRLRLVNEGKKPSFLGVDVPIRNGVRSLVLSF